MIIFPYLFLGRPCTQAPNKTAFLIEAKIVNQTILTPFAMTSTTVQNTISANMMKAALKIDSVIKDESMVGTISQVTNNGNVAPQVGGTGVGNVGDGRFNVLGLSLVGDGAKKIEIESIINAGSVRATMSGYLIDT